MSIDYRVGHVDRRLPEANLSNNSTQVRRVKAWSGCQPALRPWLILEVESSRELEISILVFIHAESFTQRVPYPLLI